MKKILKLFALLVSFAVIFASCSEDEDSPYTDFKDYVTFSESRVAWSEPSEYNFTYDFRIGSQYVQTTVTVVVKDGKTTYTFADKDATEETVQELFSSISEVYKYFDEHWQDVKAKKNANLGISFSAEYKTESRKTYPSVLQEKVEWCGTGDAPAGADSGGVVIKITDFSVSNVD